MSSSALAKVACHFLRNHTNSVLNSYDKQTLTSPAYKVKLSLPVICADLWKCVAKFVPCPVLPNFKRNGRNVSSQTSNSIERMEIRAKMWIMEPSYNTLWSENVPINYISSNRIRVSFELLILISYFFYKFYFVHWSINFQSSLILIRL